MQLKDDNSESSSRNRKVVALAFTLSHVLFLGIGIVVGVLIVNGGFTKNSQSTSRAAESPNGLNGFGGSGENEGTARPSKELVDAHATLPPEPPPTATIVTPTRPPVVSTSSPLAVPTTVAHSCQEEAVDLSSETISECLKANGIYQVVTPDTPSFYKAAKHCSYFEPGQVSDPAFVVKVSSIKQASAAVQCSAKFGLTVSPRSGAHGFGGDACRGNLVLDISMLQSFLVENSIVTWGAGMTHGPLYGRLLDYNLILPGGSEAMVGTGGFWLGCGRGVMTQAYGYSCDHLIGVEYIDSSGKVHYADASQNQDMFWMARGAGSLFPGVVTKFVAQAHPMPAEVVELSCYFRLDFLDIALKAWIKHLDEWNNPQRSLFSGFTFDRNLAKLEMNCWGCNAQQELKFLELKDAVVAEAQSKSADAAVNHCDPLHRWSVAEKLAKSRIWDKVTEQIDLFQQDTWPNFKTPNHTSPIYGSYHGSMLVPDDYPITDALVEAVTNYFRTIPRVFATQDDFERTKYFDSVYVYPMKGKQVYNVDGASTPFGGRDTQLVIHYKMEEVGDSADASVMKNHVDSFEQELADIHGLPCKGFLNYATSRFSCATTNDDWLAAFYSDPNRIKEIIRRQNRDGIFRIPIQLF